MDLSTLLASCQNADFNIRKQAEDALSQAAQQNLGELMLALVKELANDQQIEVLRQQAGMYVKLLLSAEDEMIKLQKIQQWENINGAVKQQLKAGILQTLNSQNSSNARHTAALIIGKMGAIELPKNEWPEMLQTLLSNVSGQASDETKASSLEALGYMCEEWEPQEMDQTQTNQILTCIVDGIRADRPNSIRLAAVRALLNSLDFTSANFESSSERDMLMQVICEATQCTDAGVRRGAYECISAIAALYYSKLQPYMEVLFQLTLRTIKEDVPEVSLQALEFWSTLCEEETEIKEDIKYNGARSDSDRLCMDYVKLALPHLSPLLLECLTKQDPDASEDEWGIAEAGATCLSLVALTVGDDIVDKIVPYVVSNISNENWRLRESAIMAFGAILDGPSEMKLSPLVHQAMPVLVASITDQNELVVDTAVWTVGKICELHVRSIPQEVVPLMIENLLKILEMSARVTSRACFALHMFAEAFEMERDNPTNKISPYFRVLLTKLVVVIIRDDWAYNNLRVSATEAMNMLIQNSALDVKPIVSEFFPSILQLLSESFKMNILSNDDRENQQGLQSLLCGTIQVISQKIKGEVRNFGDAIMSLLLKVFENKFAVAQEEAFMAVGALADEMEGDFMKYMTVFNPILLQGLANHEEYQVCIVAVGVVGDLCRALEQNMLNYSDDIVRSLLHNLRNPNINRHVKPPVLACLGDIALAVGGNFDKYLDVTVNMLLQAQNVCASLSPDEDDDTIDYINQLRQSILEAYSGIIQGLNDASKAGLLIPYIPGIVHFLEALAACQSKDESVLKHAVGVVGDFIHAIGSPAAPHLKNRTLVQTLVRDGQRSQDAHTRETAEWAKNLLKHFD
mmetsp:Transcript_6215/g.9298  ORF Transcript_6215/g.9298 Transcript_6215/m.9298 type:complete len:858 (-) Transcript_6215:252-2825(-)